MKNLIYTTTAFVFLLVLSSFEMNTHSSAPNPQTSFENDTSIIQSFIFHVEKYVSDGAPDEMEYGFHLKKIVESKGYLKPKSGFNHHQHEEREFTVLFFDKNDAEIYSTKVANPLIKHFEVSEEDGTLRRKRVEVNEEIITIRTNKLYNYAYHEVHW